MAVDPGDDDVIARRYGAAAEAEWRRLLKHLSLGAGFGLYVLLVPDEDGARLCRQALEREFGAAGPSLILLECDSPDALYEAPARLRELPPGPVFLSAVRPGSQARGPWRDAWAFALARLNEARDRIRAERPSPLFLVGAPWLSPLLREAAPDLWSVRTATALIEPRNGPALAGPSPEAPVVFRQMTEAEWHGLLATGQPTTPSVLYTSTEASHDPEFSLQQATDLRARSAASPVWQRLLRRAAWGFARRRLGAETRRTATDALEEARRTGEAHGIWLAHAPLAWGELLEGETERANATAARGIALAQAQGVGLGSRSMEAQDLEALVLLHEVLGRTAMRLGRTEDADRAFAALADSGAEGEDDGHQLFGALLRLRAMDLRRRGRLPEAEALLRGVLAKLRDDAAPLLLRAQTLGELASLRLAQDDADEAQALLSNALLLAEAAPLPDPELLCELQVQHARSFMKQGRYRDAAAEARRALDTLPASDDARSVLIGALQMNARFAEARPLIVESLDAELQAATSTPARLIGLCRFLTVGTMAEATNRDHLVDAERRLKHIDDLFTARKLTTEAAQIAEMRRALRTMRQLGPIGRLLSMLGRFRLWLHRRHAPRASAQSR